MIIWSTSCSQGPWCSLGIVVIGILVDDGIVIAENIYRHYEKGKSPKQAAVDGTLEVLPAIVSSKKKN